MLLKEIAVLKEQADKKLDTYETIIGILDGKFKTVSRRGPFNDTEQVAQMDLLGEDGDYRLFYVAMYNPDENTSNVEAYVVFNKKNRKTSFYDFNSYEICIDDKHIGTNQNSPEVDEFTQQYKLEAGPGKALNGAATAFYELLKEL